MLNAEESVIEALKPKALLGVRHAQVVMLFFGTLLAYAMRINMSMAIVVMTDKKKQNAFDWNMQIQSVILSSFFWGYVVLQIPAGEMAAKFGGKIFMNVVIGGNAALSFLIPSATYFGGWQALCAFRIAQGLSQSFLYPTMHNFISKWVPLQEKNRLGTIIYSGALLGNAFQLLVSGFLANLWGWPAIFYMNGILGTIWTVTYIYFGADSPQKSKMISDQERLYIQTSLGQVGEQKTLKTPWKSIWTSLPFYALLLVHCGHNWGLMTLMTEVPSYMSNILKVNIQANGAMSALPYLSLYLLSFPFGFISDYVLKKKWMRIGTARKICNSIGHFGPAIALLFLSYVPAHNITLAVGVLTVVIGLNAGYFTGFMLVHIDMAPNFADRLMGFTNFFANITSIIAPLIAGLILQDESDPVQWRHVFFLSSAIYILGNTFFVLFGSCEVQSWNTPKDSAENNQELHTKVI